ncbi:MAG TPA: nuclear transport factor 2 family protein [bacterium]|nr:nuclear transport factor 2 family protein [bacterium]HPN42226.1 nuclear transport factor 2 family protein [bacterium]
MKTKIIIMLAMVFALGNTQQVAAQMTPHEQETAKTEITKVVNRIFQSLESMDVESLFQPYSDSLKFNLFTTDGSMVNLQMAKYGHAEWFKSFSSMKITTTKEEFRFLPGNIVICSWQGKFNMTLKDGKQLKIDKFGVTFIFEKIDNNWKVIYQHSSALPPVQEIPKN